MAFMDRTVEEFSAELATGSPTPAGGAAAAAVGAFAASLGAMACRATIGNAKYPHAQGVLPASLEELEQLRKRLLALADADVQAFLKVLAAQRLPAGTEREKAARRVAFAAAYTEATRTPAETAAAAVAVARELVQVARFGNLNAAGDCGAGVDCARAAAQAALRNIAINLPFVMDVAVSAEFSAKREKLEKRSILYYDIALAILTQKLKEKASL